MSTTAELLPFLFPLLMLLLLDSVVLGYTLYADEEGSCWFFGAIWILLFSLIVFVSARAYQRSLLDTPQIPTKISARSPLAQ
jgi:hypothetical protein